jgi:hypothetical protein
LRYIPTGVKQVKPVMLASYKFAVYPAEETVENRAIGSVFQHNMLTVPAVECCYTAYCF